MTTPDHESHHEVAPRSADVSTTDEASFDAPLEVVAHNSNHSTNEQNVDVPSEWLTGNKLIAVSIAFGIADIMVALDSSILATALPTISSEFKTTSCLPVFGKIYTCFEPKTTYLTSFLVSCIGSILCAAAPISSCLILGRAVNRLAAAGILTGSLTSRGSLLTIFQNNDQVVDTPALSTVVSDIIFRRAIFGRVVPMRHRPQGMAIMVSISSVILVIGSTIGGVLTDSVLTWSIVNKPTEILALGLACSLVVFYILDRKPHPDHHLPISTKLLKLDPLSFILLLSGMTCLFVAVEFGGISVSWSNSKARRSGCEMASQVTFIAVQVVLSPSEMAHACSMEALFRQLGSAIAIICDAEPDTSSAEQQEAKSLINYGVKQAFILPLAASCELGNGTSQD
ncbi:putative mfs toxin efflux pump protein [Botrytis fragariae]|uniref:Putative mfs toxin efflux pump protein n=1 Tax=Botrytis fragariae TaxID=1964551 RepID=A0A8H6AKK1_9HELO|nr:putative mfs toxin efflux pump protein [Botrytis fragariae]KAF5869172.1 putative mfs toxin efflux pump protein [Botrytis fragariae]